MTKPQRYDITTCTRHCVKNNRKFWWLTIKYARCHHHHRRHDAVLCKKLYWLDLNSSGSLFNFSRSSKTFHKLYTLFGLKREEWIKKLKICVLSEHILTRIMVVGGDEVALKVEWFHACKLLYTPQRQNALVYLV